MHRTMNLCLLIPILAAVFCHASKADKQASKIADILLDSIKKSTENEPPTNGIEGDMEDFNEIQMLDKKGFEPGDAFADVEGRSMGDQNEDKETEPVVSYVKRVVEAQGGCIPGVSRNMYMYMYGIGVWQTFAIN